jgi:hypothetical protein
MRKLPSLKDLYFYHGSPCSIDVFDYKFAEKGQGFGFYFTTDKTGAAGFCSENPITTAAGLPFKPTLHKVRLKVENPLGHQHVQALTKAQCREIIKRAPDLEENLWRTWDVGSLGIEKALDEAAKLFSGKDCILISTLNQIANEFFEGQMGQLTSALHDVTGYDGLIRKCGKDVTIMAWFPDQVEIVSRLDPTLELDEAPSP